MAEAPEGRWIFDLPHRDAQTLVRTGAPVYLFVNPVEYHGPHLSLHNDSWLARGLARRAHEALQWEEDWPLLLAADLEVAVDPAPGPGTRATELSRVRRLVFDACSSLVDLGARRIVLMTFHGAPLHNWALQDAVDHFWERGVSIINPFNLVLRTQVDLNADDFSAAVEHLSEADGSRLLDRLELDMHAGFFETSVALALAPHTVSSCHEDLPPCPRWPAVEHLHKLASLMRRMGKERMAREMDYAAAASGWHHLDPFPGYTSEPALANAVSGEVFVEAILERYLPVLRAAMLERRPGPKPPMGWVRTMTLGGRLQP